jgi:hypothetical protein
MLLGRYEECLSVFVERIFGEGPVEGPRRYDGSIKLELTELGCPIESKGGFVISDRNSWLSMCYVLFVLQRVNTSLIFKLISPV